MSRPRQDCSFESRCHGSGGAYPRFAAMDVRRNRLSYCSGSNVEVSVVPKVHGTKFRSHSIRHADVLSFPFQELSYMVSIIVGKFLVLKIDRKLQNLKISLVADRCSSMCILNPS